MLLHRRLQYPSFLLLKNMYPQLFEKLPFDKLIGDACQLAKLKRNSDPIEDNRCQVLFQVIHCDIRGLPHKLM